MTSAAGSEKWLEDITKCSICMGTCIDPRSLTCGHTFCLKCLKSLFRTNSNPNPFMNMFQNAECPLCRQPAMITFGGPDALPKNIAVQQLVELRRNAVVKLLESDGKSSSHLQKELKAVGEEKRRNVEEKKHLAEEQVRFMEEKGKLLMEKTGFAAEKYRSEMEKKYYFPSAVVFGFAIGLIAGWVLSMYTTGLVSAFLVGLMCIGLFALGMYMYAHRPNHSQGWQGMLAPMFEEIMKGVTQAAQQQNNWAQ